MKYPIIYPLALLFTYCFILNCNGCKDQPCEYDGYDYNKGKCTCPSGKYEVNGWCKALLPNEYFGITTGCDCKDSSFFEVKYPYVSGGDTVMLITQKFKNNANGHNWEFDIIKTASGDSLSGRTGINPSRCPVKGWPSTSRTYGKLSKDKNLLKIYLYSETAFIIGSEYLRDTCVYICRR